MRTNWTKPPHDFNLDTNQVDIWRIFIDQTPASMQQTESTLSADESQRAARFRFDKDRHRFTVSHFALRDILSRYLHIEPEKINYTVSEYGKPVIKSDLNLDFNLSHSGNHALIAVARDRKIGVDVEHFRDEMEFEKIARRFFSEKENAELLSLPSDRQRTGFFNCWTRKEAYIKAHGLGLSLPLDSFDVSLAPDEPAVLRTTRPNTQEASRWTLLSLDVDSQYAGAVAVEGRDLDFRCWDWNVSQ